MTSTVCFPIGNLCPEGSVIKATSIDPQVVDADGVYRKTGPARVFTTEREAVAAVKGQTDRPIRPGDVVVLIARGPLGSGMEETYQITSALKYLKWGRDVALVTDARFSGVSTGACIGHAGPEALAGGPIGKVRDGDRIRIIIDRNTLVGSVDFIGEGDREFPPEQGARILAARPPRDDLRPDPQFQPTRGSGPPSRPPAGGPGGAACTTSSASLSCSKPAAAPSRESAGRTKLRIR
jgi:xylonate dehydratase